jgi:hypothetical protein
MNRFRRLHDSGTEAIVHRGKDSFWRVQVNIREPSRPRGTVMGFLVSTLEEAKHVADRQMVEFGHVCNGACEDWMPYTT